MHLLYMCSFQAQYLKPFDGRPAVLLKNLNMMNQKIQRVMMSPMMGMAMTMICVVADLQGELQALLLLHR